MKYLKVIGIVFLMFFVAACSSFVEVDEEIDEVKFEDRFYTQENGVVEVIEEDFPMKIGNYDRTNLKLEKDPTIEFGIIADYSLEKEKQVIYFVKNLDDGKFLKSLDKANFVKAGDYLFFEGLNFIYFVKGEFDVVLINQVNEDYYDFDLWIRDNFELDDEMYNKINISEEYASLEEFILSVKRETGSNVDFEKQSLTSSELNINRLENVNGNLKLYLESISTDVITNNTIKIKSEDGISLICDDLTQVNLKPMVVTDLILNCDGVKVGEVAEVLIINSRAVYSSDLIVE
ncbi:MAG: hypothetical protein KC550_04180 [Nanoarchaeota archaeon]|nr:hypothetical protein [Nanoarchaeota archaeon]